MSVRIYSLKTYSPYRWSIFIKYRKYKAKIDDYSCVCLSMDGKGKLVICSPLCSEWVSSQLKVEEYWSRLNIIYFIKQSYKWGGADEPVNSSWCDLAHRKVIFLSRPLKDEIHSGIWHCLVVCDWLIDNRRLLSTKSGMQILAIEISETWMPWLGRFLVHGSRVRLTRWGRDWHF